MSLELIPDDDLFEGAGTECGTGISHGIYQDIDHCRSDASLFWRAHSRGSIQFTASTAWELTSASLTETVSGDTARTAENQQLTARQHLTTTAATMTETIRGDATRTAENQRLTARQHLAATAATLTETISGDAIRTAENQQLTARQHLATTAATLTETVSGDAIRNAENHYISAQKDFVSSAKERLIIEAPVILMRTSQDAEPIDILAELAAMRSNLP